MQNKRIRLPKDYRRGGIVRRHIENNLRHYIIVTIIFLVRRYNWRFICK